MAPSKDLTPEQIADIDTLRRDFASAGSFEGRLLDIIEQLQRELAEARNRPVEGWMRNAAEELIEWSCGWGSEAKLRLVDIMNTLARHAPDLEAIKQQARKDALLEAAEHFAKQIEHIHTLPFSVGPYGGLLGGYMNVVNELMSMANASPAEPPKEKNA